MFYRNTEPMVRERFVKSVKRGVGELRINKATTSPISGLIENAVIEVTSSYCYSVKKLLGVIT